MKWMLLLFLFFFSTSARAYDLEGSMQEKADGTYSVVLKNNYGRTFTGVAVDQGDGEFDVTVKDGKGTTFTGTALDNENGGYMLDLENEETGDVATGVLDEE